MEHVPIWRNLIFTHFKTKTKMKSEGGQIIVALNKIKYDIITDHLNQNLDVF